MDQYSAIAPIPISSMSNPQTTDLDRPATTPAAIVVSGNPPRPSATAMVVSGSVCLNTTTARMCSTSYSKGTDWILDSLIDTRTQKHRTESLTASLDSTKFRRRLTQPFGTFVHEVSRVDTLDSISLRYSTTPSHLLRLNKLSCRMLFPGQVLYVPDPDAGPPPSPITISNQFLPSTSVASSDNITQTTGSPSHHTPPSGAERKLLDIFRLSQSVDVPTVKQQQPSALSRTKSDPGGDCDTPQSSETGDTGSKKTPRKKPTRQETEKFEEECSEKFLKINAKFISKNKGTVGGVLLVTPNAVMFDPNVSDPLVVEEGCECYGVLAPLDTILSASMYSDISMMQEMTSGPERTKSVVYHSKCPIHGESGAEGEFDTQGPTYHESGVENSPCQPSEGATCTCLSRKKTSHEGEGSGLEIGSPRTDVKSGIGLSLFTAGGVAMGTLSIDTLEATSGPADNNSTADLSVNNTSEIFNIADEPNTSPPPVRNLEESAQYATEDIRNKHAAKSDKIRPGSSDTGVREDENTYNNTGADDEMDGGGTSRCHENSAVVSTAISDESSSDERAQDLTEFVNFSSGIFAHCSPPCGDEGKESCPCPDINDIFDTSVDPEKVRMREKSHDVEWGAFLNEEPNSDLLDHLPPSLFTNVDDMIPIHHKPDYETPPMYLRLIVSQPMKRTFSKKSQYFPTTGKDLTKPEYWFAIPTERVDHLYAFFIQWTPAIYGIDELETLTGAGFVVVDSDDELHKENNSLMELAEKHLGLDQVNKDWEIISIDERQRRRHSVFEESFSLPKLQGHLGGVNILTQTQVQELFVCFPARIIGHDLHLYYSTMQHGFSLRTLYRNLSGLDSPVLLVIRDRQDYVFGAFLSEHIHTSEHFYGTGETFLFKLFPSFLVYPWTGDNMFFIKGGHEGVAVGGGDGNFGIWIDSSLYHGHSTVCKTFNNDVLSNTEDFIVADLEAWAFI